MAYIALYRKYRSQSFDELIGQQHITNVLQNAIRLGRISHAYLFCGPRGCGKTSTARLLARALNCQKSDGPTAEPCGVCDMCVRIRQGSAMDIIEMDAASETGIDDVREKIIENAKYAPGEARYKVYIIDEVHDLSLKAFDSLLKTIEEPPAHVVFILATTEAHKVPITVRSRCQRMDFKRGSLHDLIGNIKRVLDAESIEYEPEAVAAVARAAEGSFRDSLSLLEQSLAYTDGKLTAEAVHASVGTVGPQLLDEVTRTLAQDDMQAAFVKAGELVESGKDVKQTLIALQLHLRDLLVAGMANTPAALADASPERFAQLKEQSRWFTGQQLLRMLDILSDTERDLRFTNQHRLLLERAFWNILPSSLAGSAQQAAAEQPPVRAQAAPTSDQRKPTNNPTTQRPNDPVPSTIDQRPTTNDENSTADQKPLTPGSQRPNDPASDSPPSQLEPDELEADAAGRFTGGIDLDGIRRIWPKVIRKVTQVSKAASAIFTNEVQVMALEGKFVILGFPDEFKRSRADKPKGREALEQALTQEIGIQGFKVKCVLVDEPDAPPVDVPDDGPVGLDFPPDPLEPPKMSNGTYPDIPPQVPSHAAVVTAAAPVREPDEDENFLRLVMDELDCRPADD
jgi:DNA polymerase-3 subunit gamma/tau